MTIMSSKISSNQNPSCYARSTKEERREKEGEADQFVLWHLGGGSRWPVCLLVLGGGTEVSTSGGFSLLN